ncbi:MAG: hypothetical protein ACT4P6_18100 [Gemmatimonadaceae bacterium]
MSDPLNPAVFGIVVAVGSLIAFLGIWFIVTTLLAIISGWTELAAAFPGGSRPGGQILRRLVLKVGAVGEKGVTALIPTADGLYLESHPLFRFRRPAVHIPWRRIRYVDSHRVLWQRSLTFDLGGITTIRVRDRALAVFQAGGVQVPTNVAA